MLFETAWFSIQPQVVFPHYLPRVMMSLVFCAYLFIISWGKSTLEKVVGSSYNAMDVTVVGLPLGCTGPFCGLTVRSQGAGTWDQHTTWEQGWVPTGQVWQQPWSLMQLFARVPK